MNIITFLTKIMKIHDCIPLSRKRMKGIPLDELEKTCPGLWHVEMRFPYFPESLCVRGGYHFLFDSKVDFEEQFRR